MALAPGTRLGIYEIAAQIGVGGMGEVYRATDINLKRAVAIKVLPEALWSDIERIARFEREAKTLAALNHPNIAQIYGFEKASGVHALVMELVEGITLADSLAQRPLLVDEALPIARQIAEALGAAHAQGIIHRDLKPANIKIRADGTVKVLDFGLAKAIEGADPGLALSQSPTITSPALMTGAGTILGTAAYMSPEQARGKTVDKRADIWAFGCVVYEMLTARKAFDRENVSDTIVALLRDEPDWRLLPADVSQTVRLLLERALTKDLARRVPDVSTAIFLLSESNWPAGGSGSGPDAHGRSHSRTSTLRRVLPWASALAASAAALSILALWAPWRPRPSSPPVRLSMALPPEQPLTATIADRQLAISPDGSRLAYAAGPVGAGQLVVREMNQLAVTPLPGVTDGRSPFFSPDGRWIGFAQGSTELRKIAVTGGPSLTLCQIAGALRGASWRADDTIVFATADPATGLFSVPARGGDAKAVTTPDTTVGEIDHLFPSWLPDGNTVLFTVTMSSGLASARIEALDVATGQRRVLITGGSAAEYVAPGFLVYAASGTLRAVRFDAQRLEILGDPIPVVDQVQTLGTGAAEFSTSASGSLVYVPGNVSRQDSPRVLTWVDRAGHEEPLAAPVRSYFTLRLAPDGSRVVLDVRDQERDLWMWDFARRTLARLTFGPALEMFPVWTPDGRRVVFSSIREGAQNIFWRAADGTGSDERLTVASGTQFATSISPDGSALIVTEVMLSSSNDLAVLSNLPSLTTAKPGPSDAARIPRPLVQTPATENNGELSPDGRWLAYESDESGRNQIYVRPFPGVNDGRWQISANGGGHPLWAHSGRELFYIEPSGALMATPVGLSTTFTPGTPSKLFDGDYFFAIQQRSYDLSLDDRRFLMIKSAPGESGLSDPLRNIFVVLNWSEELSRLVTTK